MLEELPPEKNDIIEFELSIKAPAIFLTKIITDNANITPSIAKVTKPVYFSPA